MAITRTATLSCAGAIVTALLYGTGVGASVSVPTDAQGGCPISAGTVAAMFTTGSPSLNGVVKAADSTVDLQPNCGFFQWSEQMFLWLTSPAPAAYGGGSRIMFSPKFFTVTPEDGGRREFIRNNPRLPFRMLLRKTELGPHGLPALVSRSGHVIEVQPVRPGGPPPVVRLSNGALARIGAARRAADGTLRLFDARGAALQVRTLALPPIIRSRVQLAPGRSAVLVPRAAFRTAISARKLVVGRIPIFLDAQGNVIDVEPGQADGGVLLTQNGSLIYYISAVNDVYAYHRTMQGAALIPANTGIAFPLTAADGAAVKAFASGKGHTILEPDALAVETKSSWVEATSVGNPASYVQNTAIVPTFNTSDPNNWIPNGQKTVKLVMVGIHVVGSTKGHGEMVWGSFEHADNSPNATYKYNSTTGVKTVAQNTAGSWTFTPPGSAGPFNAMKASWNGTAITGSPVASSAVLRAFPWGTTGSNTSLNTQVISANASVLSQLIAGDVRKNYFQVGTTWTIGGSPPSGGNEVGTNQLANATIETFAQGTNCFSCHFTNKVAVSHIYRELKPLP